MQFTTAYFLPDRIHGNFNLDWISIRDEVERYQTTASQYLVERRNFVVEKIFKTRIASHIRNSEISISISILIRNLPFTYLYFFNSKNSETFWNRPLGANLFLSRPRERIRNPLPIPHPARLDNSTSRVSICPPINPLNTKPFRIIQQ